MSAYLSVKEAAELAGVSKSALFKAINSGRLSAEKEVGGAWKIQVVELERAYELNGHSAPTNGHSPAEVRDVPQGEYTPSTESQQILIEQLQLRLQEVIEARDALVAAKDDTIGDLRARLNIEQEERRRLSMLLAAPTPAPAPQPQPQRKGFWQRLFGGE